MTKTKHPFYYEGFSNPNGTIVPDDVFDRLLPELTEAELRVLLYIVRRTFGFKKDRDAISLSQMVKGIQARDGRILDRGTGMTRRGVMKGVAGLKDKGVIEVNKRTTADGVNLVNVYRLRFKDRAVRGIGNDVRYGGEQHSTPLGNEMPPQQTVLQQTVKQNNVGVNDFGKTRKPEGQVEYLVGEIEKVTADTHSRQTFRAIAADLPDQTIFQILAEIKQGQGIRNRGAVFVAAARKRLHRHTEVTLYPAP